MDGEPDGRSARERASQTAATVFLRLTQPFLQLQIQRDNRTALWQSGSRVKFQLTNHVRRAVEEREIPIEWVERTLEEPELTVPTRMTRKSNGAFGEFLNLAAESFEWRLTGRLNRTE